MTTPLYNAAERIIRGGMWNAALIGRGSDPDSETLASYTQDLNDLIMDLQIDGLKLWLQLDESISLTAGKASYTLKPGGDVSITRPTRVVDSGYYLDNNSNRRPLRLITRDEYNRLSNVAQTGPINQYWPDKQQSQLVISFWLVPDSTAALGTAHIIIQQQVTRITSLTDIINFPDEWLLGLQWMFAAQICTGQPSAVIARCEQKAMYYKERLQDWDVEDGSTTFQPDAQMLNQSRFQR